MRIEITDQETVSFVRTDDRVAVETLLSASSGWRLRPLTLKSFFNEPVLGLYCKSQRLLSQCRDLLQQKGIPLWEADVRTVDRYLSERFITGDVEVQLSQSNPSGCLINPAIRKGERNALQLRCASLDIETALDGTQLYSIAVHCVGGHKPQVKRIFMLGQPQPAGELDIRWFADERELIDAFLQWMQEDDADVILGWNVVNFDLRFLQKRCDELRIAFSLGRGSGARSPAAPPVWRVSLGRESGARSPAAPPV